MAISTIKNKIRKIFFWKNAYHNVVEHVPSFQLSARSSSFFSSFFLAVYGKPFYDSPYMKCKLGAIS